MMNNLQTQIFSEGQLVSSNVVSLDIINSVNKIPYAQVVISEGGAESKSLTELSNEACFAPGREIKLLLSSPAGEATFEGIVIKHNIKKTGYHTYLTIDIKDSAHKLSLLRKSAVFADKEDKEIITELAKSADIEVECAETTLQHKQMVQYYCTNWDFIISRAEANGLLVCVKNGKIELKKAELSAASTVLTRIFEYEIEADLSSQYKEVDGVCWDFKELKPIRVTNTNQDLNLQGDHDFNELATAMGADKCVFVSGISGEAAEMEAWANAGILKNRHSLVQGRISIEGNPQLQLGDVVTIAEAGELFNATVIVSGIRHRINGNGWTTDIQCGLSGRWFYTKDDLAEKPAAGLLPGINGLQIGIVEAYPSDGDPDKVHRVKVRIPAIDEKESVIWARLTLPYAGNERGVHWVPEEGDEVVIGFFNDDPRHAVVLGSLYNGQTTPPLEFTAENNEKGLITRNGNKILFTDEQDKEKLEISTPGGNKALLEDENGITVEDINQNKITLHDKGMLFEDKFQNKITTNDKGAIIEDTNKNTFTLNKQGVEVKDANGNSITLSSAGVEIKDMNGNKMALEAGGITLQSSGNVTVKGTMINLN